MRRLLFCALVALTFGIGCNSPSAPTPPPPPPPPPDAPSLSCGDDLSRTTTDANGARVTFETPQAQNGQTPVTVACSPASDTVFPMGTTTVSCTATDALQRQATCSFNVTVARLPQLSRTRFLAFGDSVTAGEVTVPTGALVLGRGGASRQVVVPSASYPTVLERTLRGRYSAQASVISVANYGLPGEKVVDARPRFISALNAVRPEVVLLMGGYNDIPSGADGAASGAANEMRLMAAEARSRGMRVFIATLTPSVPGRFRAISQFLLLDYVQRIRAVAAAEDAVLVDLYQQMLPDAERYIGVDGLHPNEAGYTRMADLFFQAIQNTFEVR